MPGHHSRHFPLTNLFNIHNHPIGWLLLLSHLTDGQTGPERLSNLPQITQLINGRMRQSTHTWPQNKQTPNHWKLLPYFECQLSARGFTFTFISVSLFQTATLQGRHSFPHFSDKDTMDGPKSSEIRVWTLSVCLSERPMLHPLLRASSVIFLPTDLEYYLTWVLLFLFLIYLVFPGQNSNNKF